MNNLPKVVTQRCLEQDLNSRPSESKSIAQPVALPRHLVPLSLRKLRYFSLSYLLNEG